MRLTPCGYLQVNAQKFSFGRLSPEALVTIELAQSGFAPSPPAQQKAREPGRACSYGHLKSHRKQNQGSTAARHVAETSARDPKSLQVLFRSQLKLTFTGIAKTSCRLRFVLQRVTMMTTF